MAVTRVRLAILLFLGFCAVNKVECTVVLMSTAHTKVNLFIMNDLSLSVKVEGPGRELTEVQKGAHTHLNFEGSGQVTVKEDDKVILNVTVGSQHLDIVRTHANAHLTHVQGDIAINQIGGNLQLSISGNGSRRHSFALSEDKSSTQSVSIDEDSIAIQQSSDLVNQHIAVHGSCENRVSFTQDKSDNQNIVINGDGLYSVFMVKDKGITTVTRRYDQLD